MKLGRDEKHTSSIRLGRAINYPAWLYVYVTLLLFCAWGSAWAGCTPASMGYGAEVIFYGPNQGCGGDPAYSFHNSPGKVQDA